MTRNVLPPVDVKLWNEILQDFCDHANLKNKDDLKNNDNFKTKENLKNKDNSKMKMTSTMKTTPK